MSHPSLSARRIFGLWWPLALSWLLMGAELPLFSACVARMPGSEIHLAAYGSLVFPLALVIEAPIIMLLAAATALAGDWDSWRKVRRAMHRAGAVLTVLHVLVAFTPLFDLLARRLFEVPEEVIEPARLGLRVLTPWTWAIAYRRTHQGVLIRFEKGRPVVIGTLIRLLGNVSVYVVGFALQHTGRAPSGILVGSAAVAVGVSSEALFVGWCTRRALAAHGLPELPEGERLTRAAFLRFYVPLALTPLIALLVPPMGSAAMARMNEPLASLAVWPAFHGLVFFLRSGGFAYNEVVLSLLDRPGSVPALRRFGVGLALLTSGILITISVTPLAGLWFGGLMGLSPELAGLGSTALLVAGLWPASQAMQSWFQGRLVHGRHTREVTWSIVVAFVVSAVLLFLAVHWNPGPGLYLTVAALMTGNLAQSCWLGLRAKRVYGSAAR